MIERLISFALKQRFITLALVGLLIAAGVYALATIPIDAFPDLTNNQVTIITEAAGMAAGEVEAQVTFPIEGAMLGLPRTEEVRSISKFGLSLITVVFEDGVNTYFARQLVNERLNDAKTRIPNGLEPTLGPVATAFGEVYQYTLEDTRPNKTKTSVMDLKTLHDWFIKLQLRTVPGVGEINSWGGETMQYQVLVDPAKLLKYGLTLHDVFNRVAENNSNFGGGYIEHRAEQYTVRGVGLLQSSADIENIVVNASVGTPVYLRDVAEIAPGAMQRQGAVSRDAKGETLAGMVIILKGENGKSVAERVKQKITELQAALPAGVSIKSFYDQTEVIDQTIETVKWNLIEGALLVIVVLFLFLRNVRASLIVAAVIPISMVSAFIVMKWMGVSANLMSLGAVDFGLIVDGAVVMMENFIRRLGVEPRAVATGSGTRFTDSPVASGSVTATIHDAAIEVGRPILFGVLIIIAVYLPVFTLQGLESRMFTPMAITVCAALLGSLLLALLFVPAMSSLMLRGKIEEREGRIYHFVQRSYVRLLDGALDHRWLTIGAAVLVVAAAVGSLAFIGTEFMPRLDEGSILIETRKLPSVALTESVNISQQVEEIVKGFPEVESVVTKIGRPDLATEAMGIHQGDVYVILKPHDQWPKKRTKEELIEALDAELSKLPGVAFNFTQPMAMRLDETISGVKADVAVKLFGEDLAPLEEKAAEIARVLEKIPGSADVQAEALSGAAQLQISVRRDQIARYGLNVADVRELIETAVGGKVATTMIDGQKRFDVLVRFPESFRNDPDAIAALPLTAPAGERLRLSDIANVELIRAPDIINRENNQRRIVIQSNVRGRDIGSFVAEARSKISAAVKMPTGYFMAWGGQFENQERATQRLFIVVPLAMVLIFALLFIMFGSIKHSLLIILNVPFAVVGGIAALWLRGLNLSLSASIGFIALFGVAVLNGVVMIAYINKLRDDGFAIREAVREGARIRLRPVLMTALVASLGFIPMAISTNPGAEVQRPLATVVIGGLVTSTLLTLLVLPVIYRMFEREPKQESEYKYGPELEADEVESEAS
ncbi:MAG: CusA/CzcA family heavy metal efflux RND transporter [Acidobacteriota bacterium]|nr:CusA/CzcA family heavy metal efflux RND transporter [Acidobacteriota bacterium]